MAGSWQRCYVVGKLARYLLRSDIVATRPAVTLTHESKGPFVENLRLNDFDIVRSVDIGKASTMNIRDTFGSSKLNAILPSEGCTEVQTNDELIIGSHPCLNRKPKSLYDLV